MTKLLRPFSCVSNGEINVRTFAPGDECPPEHEASALALGCFNEPDKAPPVEANSAAKQMFDDMKSVYESRLAAAEEKLAASAAEIAEFRATLAAARDQIGDLQLQLAAAAKNKAAARGGAGAGASAEG